jgi:hypothetical protein
MDDATYQAILAFAQVGGQYLIPLAALLRAMYSGIRGKMPEGFMQIISASVLTGIIAVMDGDNPNIQTIAGDLIGNTMFMAGLLTFIMLYLLRQPNRGYWVDGIVGAVIGVAVWIVWSFILGNEWPWWAVPLAVIAGAAGFVILRSLLRQLARLVTVATFLIRIGFIFLIGAGLVLAYQAVTGMMAGGGVG